MATVALPRPAERGALRDRLRSRSATMLGLGGLVALSVLLRTTRMDVGYWIDEGLSVGIASFPLLEIPGALRQDGSPPLFYVLLHLWQGAFGTDEPATHALSLLFACLTIPVAFVGARAVWDERTAWFAAALFALNPFLGSYAQETRMYALLVLLSLVTTTCFLLAYVREREERRYAVGFGVGLAAMLLTHNWALFAGVAFFAAGLVALRAAPDRAARVAFAKRLAVGFGIASALYLPWLPTFLFQAANTGAPWALRPGLDALLQSPDRLLAGREASFVCLLAAGAGLVALWRGGGRDRRVLVPALLVVALGPIVIAWLASQASPAWANRYLTVALAPLLLCVAAGLGRARALGVAGLALLVLTWAFASQPALKSNARFVARQAAPQLKAGDLVVSTQPEQAPVLAHYLPDGLRFATLTGALSELRVTDWRDGPQRLERTGADRDLVPLVDRLRPGQRVLLVRPSIFKPERWKAEWTGLVRDRSIEWEAVLRGDPRLRSVATIPRVRRPGPNPLQGLLFERTRG